ncbi:hypothetical protein PG991_005916 [Apiospora marii]|uniref:Uncharacterized protein n=1 Tax=Apiospora marii TaxID=335849 RepID=A0ABR1SBT9_9PEZI
MSHSQSHGGRASSSRDHDVWGPRPRRCARPLAEDQRVAVLLLREARDHEVGQHALGVGGGDLDAPARRQVREPFQGRLEAAGPLDVLDEVVEGEEAGQDQGRDVEGLAAAVVVLGVAVHAGLDPGQARLEVGVAAGVGRLEDAVEVPHQVVVHVAAGLGIGAAALVGHLLPLAGRHGRGGLVLQVLEVAEAHLGGAGAHLDKLLDDAPAAVDDGEPERRRVEAVAVGAGVVGPVHALAPAAVDGLLVDGHVVLHHAHDQLVAVAAVRDGVVDGQGAVAGLLGLGAALLEQELLAGVPLVVVALALVEADPGRGVQQLAADAVRDRGALGDRALDGLLEQRVVGRGEDVLVLLGSLLLGRLRLRPTSGLLSLGIRLSCVVTGFALRTWRLRGHRHTQGSR